jgi:hypothetical protein
LTDHPAHRLDVQMQRLGNARVVERFNSGAQDAQRRAQLMGGVGGEFALNPKSLIEPVERLVDRRDQRPDLVWNFIERQTDIGARGPDLLGNFRCLPQRQKSAAEDRNIRDQQHQQNRKRDPADMLEEVLDNVVDQDVAVGEVFRRLDPHRLAADSLANARAVDGRAVLTGFQKLNRGRVRVGGKYRRLVLQRREQGFSLIIDHGVGVSPIGLRIEALKIGRKFKREAAIGLRHKMLGKRQGLLFHCVIVDVVGRDVQQPRQRERHQNGRDGHRNHVQDHDPRDD